MIQIRDLHKSFRRNQVLKGVNLELSAGLIHALVGHNGSGKTTLIKSILGLVHPSAGTITVHSETDVTDPRGICGYMPQISQFPENLSSGELLDMIVDLRDQEAARREELIARFDFAAELTRPLRVMSGGTRQKVNVIIALMFDAPVLLLDEPTAGLDPVASQQLKIILHEERCSGKTILITSHNTHELEKISDSIIYLSDGRIVYQGDLERLKSLTATSDLEASVAHLMNGS